jgi:hypothetical protein
VGPPPACQRFGTAVTFAPMRQFLDELAWRGLLTDETPELRERLARGTITGSHTCSDQAEGQSCSWVAVPV